MVQPRKMISLRLEDSAYEEAKTLAEAETRANTSEMLRTLILEALTARRGRITNVSRSRRNVSRSVEGVSRSAEPVDTPADPSPPAAKPAKSAGGMPDPSDKLKYARWMRENR